MPNVLPMQVHHIEEVYRIECDSFATPWSMREFERELNENAMAHYVVAVEDDHVVGYCGIWHIVNEAHLTNIAVAPTHRGRGIGQLLLDDVFRFARDHELIGITLEVRVSNASAQRLYTKNGFHAEGVRKQYYSDTKEDALIMWAYIDGAIPE